MKKTKIFYGNQYIGSTTIDGNQLTKWQIFRFRAVRRIQISLKVMGIFFLGVWVYYGISLSAPAKVMAIDKPVYITATSTPPVMLRIAKCESGNTQIDPKTGQVLMRYNAKSNSMDIGYYQINETYNGKDASSHGFDLTKKADNIAYAMQLYAERGTEPWSASAKCWR